LKSAGRIKRRGGSPPEGGRTNLNSPRWVLIGLGDVQAHKKCDKLHHATRADQRMFWGGERRARKNQPGKLKPERRACEGKRGVGGAHRNPNGRAISKRQNSGCCKKRNSLVIQQRSVRERMGVNEKKVGSKAVRGALGLIENCSE